MTAPKNRQPCPNARFAALSRCAAAVLVAALVSRVMAAGVLQSFVDRLRPARLCVFPDTNYYWLLAQDDSPGQPL